jgi:hypothetical protein
MMNAGEGQSEKQPQMAACSTKKSTNMISQKPSAEYRCNKDG